MRYLFLCCKIPKKGGGLLAQIKSKEEVIRESMNSSKRIDTSISFNIPRSTQLFDATKHQYKCTCCGKGFSTQKIIFKNQIAHYSSQAMVIYLGAKSVLISIIFCYVLCTQEIKNMQ